MILQMEQAHCNCGHICDYSFLQIVGHNQTFECDVWTCHERGEKKKLFLKFTGYSGMIGN